MKIKVLFLNKWLIGGICTVIVLTILYCFFYKPSQAVPVMDVMKYREISYPTPNYDSTRVNEVLGVILHHTAELTAKRSLEILSSPEKKVGAHVVIDTDGTRFVMARPEVVTYHAGLSILNGRESCNLFTIGIEFQGNTLNKPLTNEQIESAIEYLMPIISKYDISLHNIVTHEMVRNAYKKEHPEKKCSGKVDITPKEYDKFMMRLRNHIEKEI